MLKVTGNKRIVENVRCMKPMKGYEVDELMHRQKDLYMEMKEKWESLGISALITPNFPTPAFKDTNVNRIGMLRDYQFIWSILHYPAGVVPVTKADTDGDLEYYPGGDGHNDIWTREIRRDLESAGGMPVGVQVIARKWEDEVALGVMKALENGLGESCHNIKPPVALKVAA
jgi:fatty acid amide hydrolase